MGLYLDLDKLRVFGARKRPKWKTADGASTFVFRYVQEFFLCGQMRVIPATMTLALVLLTARPLLYFGPWLASLLVVILLGFAAKELSFSKVQFGLEFRVLFLQPGLSFRGPSDAFFANRLFRCVVLPTQCRGGNWSKGKQPHDIDQAIGRDQKQKRGQGMGPAGDPLQ
jgi:hypothetical protein